MTFRTASELYDELNRQLLFNYSTAFDYGHLAGDYLMMAAGSKNPGHYKLVLRWYQREHDGANSLLEEKVVWQRLSAVLTDEQYEYTMWYFGLTKWNQMASECETFRPEDMLSAARANFAPPTPETLLRARTAAAAVATAPPHRCVVPYPRLETQMKTLVHAMEDITKAGAYLAAAAAEGKMRGVVSWYETARIRRTPEQEAEDWAAFAAVASPAQGDAALELMGHWLVRLDIRSRPVLLAALQVARERRADPAAAAAGDAAYLSAAAASSPGAAAPGEAEKYRRPRPREWAERPQIWSRVETRPVLC